MDLQQIKTFIDAMAASGLAEMEVSHDGWTLRLVRRPGPGAVGTAPDRPPIVAPVEADDAPAATIGDGHVRAPLYGVVHLRPSPEAPPFVAVGRAVRAGDALCVIEAMKVFNQIRAERDGTVEAVLVACGQEVEAGQPLMRLA